MTSLHISPFPNLLRSTLEAVMFVQGQNTHKECILDKQDLYIYQLKPRAMYEWIFSSYYRSLPNVICGTQLFLQVKPAIVHNLQTDRQAEIVYEEIIQVVSSHTAEGN